MKCYTCVTVDENTDVILFIYESKGLMRLKDSIVSQRL